MATNGGESGRFFENVSKNEWRRMATNGDEWDFGPERAFTRGNEGMAGKPKGTFWEVLTSGRIFWENEIVTKW